MTGANSQDENLNSYTTRQRVDYTRLQNELIRSPSLSCKAYKLLSVGLSHSGKWKFNKTQIATCFKEGQHTVDAAMKELRALGYLHLVAKKRADGKMEGHRWFWFDTPLNDEEFKKFYRDGGFPEFGDFGASENHPCLRRLNHKKIKDSYNNLNKKVNVSETLPSSPSRSKKVAPPSKKSPRRFINSLTHGQRKIHDEILRWKPVWGEPPKSDDVCAWFLAQKKSELDIRQGFAVYKQDAIEAERKGRTIENMAGYILSAAKKDRKVRSNDVEFNRSHAKEMERKHSWIQVMERYVKITAGNLNDEIELDLPKNEFMSQLQSRMRTAEIYA